MVVTSLKFSVNVANVNVCYKNHSNVEFGTFQTTKMVSC